MHLPAKKPLLNHSVILEQIYSVQGGRASIDDKRLRVGQLWEDLASQFFNNPDWQLELFDSQMTGPCGAEFINPITVLQPHAQHSAKEIGQTFNNLKTIYTVVHVKFTASGNNEGGGDEFDDSIDSDDIFYESFAKSWYPNNARVLLYAHLLWKRSPPAFCMRTKTPGKQSQVGVKGTDVIPDLPAALSKRELSLSEFGDKIAGALKTIHTKSAAEIAAETEQMVKQSMCSDAQIFRDNAMSRYYTAVALEQELKVANIRAKPKFTPESFDNVQHFLSFCRFNEQEVQAYSQQLAANGFFFLGHINPPIVVDHAIPSRGSILDHGSRVQHEFVLRIQFVTALKNVLFAQYSLIFVSRPILSLYTYIFLPFSQFIEQLPIIITFPSMQI